MADGGSLVSGGCTKDGFRLWLLGKYISTHRYMQACIHMHRPPHTHTQTHTHTHAKICGVALRKPFSLSLYFVQLASIIPVFESPFHWHISTSLRISPHLIMANVVASAKSLVH